MAVIDPHSNRPTGFILTSAAYNEDHQKHVTNVQAVNAEIGDKITEAAFNNAIGALEDQINAIQEFEAGTRILFQQSTAPAGWTKETNSAFNNVALRLTTGGVGSGGEHPFTTIFGKTATDNRTLSLSQIPSHNHTMRRDRADNGCCGGGVQRASGSGTDTSTSNAGGGGAHNHTMDIRVRFRDVIIATHN